MQDFTAFLLQKNYLIGLKPRLDEGLIDLWGTEDVKRAGDGGEI